MSNNLKRQGCTISCTLFSKTAKELFVLAILCRYHLQSTIFCNLFCFYPFFVPVLVFGEISLGTSTFGIKFTLQSETPIIFQEIFLHLCFF